MRPSVRFALAAAVTTALAVGIGGFLLWTPPAPQPRADRLPLRPEGLAPEAEALIGDPGPEKRAELLDRIEAVEAEQFGSVEAARRRADRERVLEQRLREVGRTGPGRAP